MVVADAFVDQRLHHTAHDMEQQSTCKDHVDTHRSCCIALRLIPRSSYEEPDIRL
jgi:hypothetical protein